MTTKSPFLHFSTTSQPNSLALIHIGRDNFAPIVLNDSIEAHNGYAGGAVLNTRFGSFPHSTLINVPWGSKIRASVVDTGSRGRKRKREPLDDGPNDSAEGGRQTGDGESTPSRKHTTTATSGFVHILKPSPELWTISLPHRTQVVYTPDYSYILQRIRAFPGKRLIEAGAGSGSFTHAAARAVYSGFPKSAEDKKGKVYSFEFHEQRFQKMGAELETHGLRGIVQLTRRDVCRDGFLVDGKSPQANAIFLDLPAPWEALPHLSRKMSDARDDEAATKSGETELVSPLDPANSVYICTFSPCIEQVTRTISTLRELGWVDIDMVEVSQRRINVFRDRVGLNLQPDRGTLQSPFDVTEAVEKLEEIDRRMDSHRKSRSMAYDDDSAPPMLEPADNGGDFEVCAEKQLGKAWLDGRLVHRSEVEMKTHTSYLVFAILPREWTEQDEAAALERWPCVEEVLAADHEMVESKKEKRKKKTAAVKGGIAGQERR